MDINILYEDNFIIVAEKPPKMPSQGDKSNDLDLYSILKNNLSKKHNIKNPYLAIINRLDRPVGGAILFAKTKPAAAYLSKEIQNKSVNKSYLTVVCGIPTDKKGILIDKLVKIGAKNLSIVKDTKNAKEAILEYSLLETIETEEYGPLSLLEIDLKTGRHHQIRVQLSHHNMPIWGDTKYNKNFSNRSKWVQIALWANKLSFKHPKTKDLQYFVSKPYNEFPWNLFNLNGE